MNRLHFPLLACTTLMALSLQAGRLEAATFTNGDFAVGFDAWQGELADFATFPPAISTVDLAAAPQHYQLIGSGRAEIGLDTQTPNPDIGEVVQAFSVTDTRHALELSIEWDWLPSDGAADTLAIVLQDDQGTLFNLIDQLFPDASGTLVAAESLRSDTLMIPGGYFASNALSLQLALADLDFAITDILQVGNIRITEMTDVTSPATTMLILGGLSVLGCLGGTGAKPRLSRATIG